ncbi:MAG: tRNA (adenosine(37)-N6)-dimethylallyltransferase MiaA [Oscillospiraceae bacterium]|nr:tRNA (adenosine(37)-N6)-dimethylallyltransferase MiaA [Oscillospiraceae bacterium]
MQTKKIICIVGPTASGKTALSIKLAKALSGEVVSGDSMQIYKGMDIGTAKPTPEEMGNIPHHMFSIVSPQDNYSVARYCDEASSVVDDIIARGKTPIVVGGTGLYIDSLVNGYEFASFEESGKYREELFELYEKNGAHFIHEMLRKVDPQRAAEVHENNVKRVIRALEIYNATGKTATEHDEETKRKPKRYDARYVGVNFRDREKLYERINLRVDMMIEQGLVSEVEKLLSEGVPETATSLQAIGYKELCAHIRGEKSLKEAIDEIKLASRRYAKRQITWFGRNKETKWIYAEETESFSSLLQDLINFLSLEGV